MNKNENELVKAALEANRERKLWKFAAHFSLIGAIISTVGFLIAVQGGI